MGMCLPQHSSAGRQVPGAEGRGDSSGDRDGRPPLARWVGQSGCCLRGCARWRPRVPREGTRPLCCQRRSSGLPLSSPQALNLCKGPQDPTGPLTCSTTMGLELGARCTELASPMFQSQRAKPHTRWTLCRRQRGCSPGRCTRQVRLLPGALLWLCLGAAAVCRVMQTPAELLASEGKSVHFKNL